jgi:hypothetical protein
MTTTIALDLPTWTRPTWAERQEEQIAGVRWVRRPTTDVAEAPDPEAPKRTVTVELAAWDWLEGEGIELRVDRTPVRVQVGRLGRRRREGAEYPLLLDLDGALSLIAALTDLVEAAEEGTPRVGAVSTAIVAVVHDEARQGIELSIPDPPTVDELAAAADALGMLPSDIVRKAEDARLPETVQRLLDRSPPPDYCRARARPAPPPGRSARAPPQADRACVRGTGYPWAGTPADSARHSPAQG